MKNLFNRVTTNFKIKKVFYKVNNVFLMLFVYFYYEKIVKFKY